MTQAQVSYTDSCPLVLRYPVIGGLESLRFCERKIDNGNAALQAQVSHMMSGGSESPMFPLISRLTLQQRRLILE